MTLRHILPLFVLLTVPAAAADAPAAAPKDSADTAAAEAAAARLGAEVEPGHAILWHLFHSGFAIKTAKHLLIFDYWPGALAPRGDEGLDAGFIRPAEIADQNVVVFVSHEHRDHFHRGVLDWQEQIPAIRYVVSPEVARRDERAGSGAGRVTVMEPDRQATVGELTVSTIESTDSGVAFLVAVDGLTLYHSGDHAAWNWKNEPGANAFFVDRLLRPLEGRRIDIAMHVCDPRLSAGGFGGIVDFASKFHPGLLVPMHAKGNYAAANRVEALLRESDPPVAFWAVGRRGDRTVFPAP